MLALAAFTLACAFFLTSSTAQGAAATDAVDNDDVRCAPFGQCGSCIAAYLCAWCAPPPPVLDDGASVGQGGEGACMDLSTPHAAHRCAARNHTLSDTHCTCGGWHSCRACRAAGCAWCGSGGHADGAGGFGDTAASNENTNDDDVPAAFCFDPLYAAPLSACIAAAPALDITWQCALDAHAPSLVRGHSAAAAADDARSRNVTSSTGFTPPFPHRHHNDNHQGTYSVAVHPATFWTVLVCLALLLLAVGGGAVAAGCARAHAHYDEHAQRA